MRALQKKMQQLENDLDQAQEQLLAANAKLEEKDKALQNVSPALCLALSNRAPFPSRVQRTAPDTPRVAESGPGSHCSPGLS